MSTKRKQTSDRQSSSGFSLVESIIAMFVIMVALLGALQAINYSIVYNAGNATRAQNLAILQQEVERLRAAKFTPSGVDTAPPPGNGMCRTIDDQRDISGGAKAPCLINAPNGGVFIVRTWIDNDPSNGPGTWDTTPVDPPGAPNATPPILPTRVKEITVEVGLAAPSPGWQTANPARVVLRRAIGN
jgi:type II secretory pathway pseudopilin PulG